MKVLIIANSSGGLYSFRKMLLEKLISQGNTVYASTPVTDNKNELENIGVSIINTEMERRGINPIKDFSLFRKYYQLIKKKSPDLVITYTIKPNVYGGLAARILKVPYAANITGLGSAFEKKGFIKQLASWLNRIGLKKAKVVFFENESDANVFIDEKIIKPEQAHVLHGAGVDIKHFDYMKYPEDNSEFRFLFIGRIMREKGFLELIQAMIKLRSSGNNCSLSVLGGFDEIDLQEQVEKYSIEGWLHYYGQQSDVRPYIEKAHCFVLPSYHEGMANTNLECAACGRPLITSNIPGCREAVIEDESGYLCNLKDVDSLYCAMLKMCNLTNTQRTEMGLVGRHHMERVFDKQLVVQETIKQLMK